MTVSDNATQAEELSNFFKELGRVSAKAGKKLATKALNNPVRFLEIGANVVNAAASGNRLAALSTLLEVVNFYHTGRGGYYGKLVELCYINGAKSR